MNLFRGRGRHHHYCDNGIRCPNKVTKELFYVFVSIGPFRQFPSNTCSIPFNLSFHTQLPLTLQSPFNCSLRQPMPPTNQSALMPPPSQRKAKWTGDGSERPLKSSLYLSSNHGLFLPSFRESSGEINKSRFSIRTRFKIHMCFARARNLPPVHKLVATT